MPRTVQRGSTGLVGQPSRPREMLAPVRASFQMPQMGINRDQLVYMALVALDEVADTCGKSPAPRSFALRFLLAWLFQQSGGNPADKWLFDSFWKEATRTATTYMEEVGRHTSVQAAMNGICRVCGWERDVDFMQEMERTRRKRSG